MEALAVEEDDDRDAYWGRTRCHYSQAFYSLLPNIHHRHRSSAVYLQKPNGYRDLPDGVTFMSGLLLAFTGCCTAGQVACLGWNCKRYVVSSKKTRSRHIL